MAKTPAQRQKDRMIRLVSNDALIKRLNVISSDLPDLSKLICNLWSIRLGNSEVSDLEKVIPALDRINVFLEVLKNESK